MFSPKQKKVILKIFSMLSVVRGYNILIIIIAQYLASVYIFAHHKSLRQVLLDVNLLMLVLATATSIAAGYIINNFYDYEKDIINRPQKSVLDTLTSKNTKLSLYFVLNFTAIIFASYVSFKAVLFFSAYIFAIWFYSHKLKRLLIIGNLISAVLTIAPFFAIFIYYRNFETVIFVHALFLFLIIAMKELTKDLENLKGDLTLGYKTIPVVYGENVSKRMLSILCLSTFAPIGLLLFGFKVGMMDYFFYFTILLLLIFLILLWLSKQKKHYLLLHNILKVIILAGVFSITLIDVSLVLNRIL